MFTKDELREKLRQKILEKKALRKNDMERIKKMISEEASDNGKRIIDILDTIPKIKSRAAQLQYFRDLLNEIKDNERSDFHEKIVQILKSKGQNEAVSMLKEIQQKKATTNKQIIKTTSPMEKVTYITDEKSGIRRCIMTKEI